jgi:hypothetical protein
VLCPATKGRCFVSAAGPPAARCVVVPAIFFFGYPSANPTAREVAVTYQPSMSCQRDSPALGKAQPGMACQRVGGQTGLTRSAHELQASPVATFSFLPLTFLFLKEKQNWIPVSPFAAGLWPLSHWLGSAPPAVGVVYSPKTSPNPWRGAETLRPGFPNLQNPSGRLLYKRAGRICRRCRS